MTAITPTPADSRADADSTLSALPLDGVIRVYVTGERVTHESAEHGDAAERGWSMRIGSPDLYPSRNDVSPLFEARVRQGYMIETGWTLADFDGPADATAGAADTLRDILAQLEGGWHTDDGSTVYAADAVTLDYASDSVFTYAVHAHVKHYAAGRGWVEDHVNIAALAGVEG
ncbi:hypothetical protein MRBLMI12_000451 [Microbacterium sp. LMI12-1-1.1]|uniref:hypothetical protein n=1 Tax=Microbacterium sp. LMI12-1-1.1 TaxID=3135225 RepID=UPI00342D560D